MTNLIGIIGALLLFIKFGIHMYIAWLQNPGFLRGGEAAFHKMELMFPIYHDATGRQRTLKKIGNVLYVASLVIMGICLWDRATGKG
jgi:hypothetical protein